MEVSNLYDNGPMSPICQINEHLAIWSEQRWLPFKVDYIEPIPRSSAYVVDLIATAGALTLAANGQIAGQLLTALQTNEDELLHARWFALDDIEGMIWELSNMARFAPRGGQAGVNLFTPIYDPWLATTTFWVLGGVGAKDARIGCINLAGVAIPIARLGFFGYRYIMTSETTIHPNARYLPAQGR